MKVGNLVKLNHVQVKGDLGIVVNTNSHLQRGHTPISRVLVMTGRHKGQTIPFEDRLLEVLNESR